ncbi:MAG TPA: single-stranded DNA-binding protein [Lactococcus sp.]|uniref:Single-stranded DNA-binding protein n=1 Tax=Lactococcus muris TaxID=2941330 RepID=A0ABV4DD97_9LACT|nr:MULTISPECIES: single-stranded DNA-binding protein [Lactococcus]MBL3717249.1 single-stranded DNA-binding protein [Lactococcus garvieae]HAP15375.1 single-stranded DNA-binding protein [Lactococcus sp.]HBC91304.1 single-stranded DNA-binding protein [Lactococcus sp.]
MINNVVLVGRLVRDPELRYTPQNTAVATFTLAVNRRFKNAQGEREADFINCVIWRQFAENLANWAKKGALIGVTGSIQVRNYENKEGQRVYVTEVLADNFQMLESRAVREGGSGSYSAPQQQQPQNSTFAGTSTASTATPDFGRDADPFGGSPMEISDDDLPF